MDEPTKLRLVFEFLRGAADDGQPLRLCVAAEPRSTGDVRFDALLAAVAQDLCVHAGIAPPGVRPVGGQAGPPQRHRRGR